MHFTPAAMPRMAACELSAGIQHMLITVSGFGTRRRLVPVLSWLLMGGAWDRWDLGHDVVQIRQL